MTVQGTSMQVLVVRFFSTQHMGSASPELVLVVVRRYFMRHPLGIPPLGWNAVRVQQRGDGHVAKSLCARICFVYSVHHTDKHPRLQRRLSCIREVCPGQVAAKRWVPVPGWCLVGEKVQVLDTAVSRSSPVIHHQQMSFATPIQESHTRYHADRQ